MSILKTFLLICLLMAMSPGCSQSKESGISDDAMITTLEKYLKQAKAGPADAEGVKFLHELKRQKLLKKD